METYYKNGIVSNIEYILSDDAPFAVQCDKVKHQNILFYPSDNLVRELDSELVTLYDAFRDLYFSETDAYYNNLDSIPIGLYNGGQSSGISIGKDEFLKLKGAVEAYLPELAKYIYVGDCQYLVSTVQNLLSSVEYCFTQYYIQISQVNLSDDLPCESNIFQYNSDQSMQLMFLVETFFTKMYSILDLMVKIVYELENPTNDFSSIKKLKCSEKLWGDRKRTTLKNAPKTIFEDCESIRIIEALRNEAVHNGSWEFRPLLFLKVENKEIVERYMLFPDFDEGRLSTVKNRKHFFSQETKINDALIAIHDEFYNRLLNTLKIINAKY